MKFRSLFLVGLATAAAGDEVEVVTPGSALTQRNSEARPELPEVADVLVDEMAAPSVESEVDVESEVGLEDDAPEREMFVNHIIKGILNGDTLSAQPTTLANVQLPPPPQVTGNAVYPMNGPPVYPGRSYSINPNGNVGVNSAAGNVVVPVTNGQMRRIRRRSVTPGASVVAVGNTMTVNSNRIVTDTEPIPGAPYGTYISRSRPVPSVTYVTRGRD